MFTFESFIYTFSRTYNRNIKEKDHFKILVALILPMDDFAYLE
jgi:hypothetical protein